MESASLDQLTHFLRIIGKNANALADGALNPFFGDSLYCPPCGDQRRMRIEPVHISSNYRKTPSTPAGLMVLGGVVGGPLNPLNQLLVPSLFLFICVQCDAQFTAIIYQSPDGPALAVLPSCRGGVTTENTPDGVAYYLDQAHRAQSVGANSGAVAMFRGALEQLLFQQGYKTKMLGTKLGKLEADIAAGSAPKWAMDLETEFLDVLKVLGDGSIHPNDGDVTKQAELDVALFARLTETFHYLLIQVYELARMKDRALSELRAKAQIIKK